MRVARLRWGSSEDFAVHGPEGGWIPFASIGIEAGSTARAIAQLRTAVVRVHAGQGRPIQNATELLCPVVAPTKVLGIGLNYQDHVRETGSAQPERPMVFAKYANALADPTGPIVVDSRLTQEADYECELAVIVGRRVRGLTAEEALSAVFGYAVANDVSARDWQRRDTQISRSKSFDTFCPIGPWITTVDEVADPQALSVTSTVNGEQRQHSSTSEMIFTVADLLSYLSETMTLEPGDVIITGTPHGVGFAMSPPRFLRPGDVVRCEIERLGAIENPVVPPSGARDWARTSD